MQVIPVIDLMGGQAVRAVRGERSAYRPIVSSLCAGSEPLAVARALLDYCGADTLYVADLDALTGGSPQAAVLKILLDALPHITIWLDGGFRDGEAFDALAQRIGPAATRLTPVFASESLADADTARTCLADPQRAILSLDRRGGVPLDPAACWRTASLWPARVIVMTLERVGAFAGPDLETLAAVGRSAPHVALIGAGGIRDESDLQAAERAGAHAWLVASALHDRRIAPRPRRS